ncbi:MAG: hypothetical protein QOC65_637 [Sphingomonadales bacterium]|nr:hypothetical protein [Sphingomonadales bacterium]
MVRPEFHAALRQWLLPGERLLWAGLPKQGLLLRSSDLYLVPFSLFFVGFALLWNQGVWEWGDTPFLFAVAGVALLLGAAYVSLGRFLVDAVVRAKLLYAVTDRRIVILRRPPWSRFRALDLSYLPVLELQQSGRGRGTINFDVAPDPQWWSHAHQPEWTPALSKVARFLEIEGAAAVYDLISRECERRRAERLARLPADRAAFIG